MDIQVLIFEWGNFPIYNEWSDYWRAKVPSNKTCLYPKELSCLYHYHHHHHYIIVNIIIFIIN